MVLASQRLPSVPGLYNRNYGRQSRSTGAIRRVEWRSDNNRILELHCRERTRYYAALLVHRSWRAESSILLERKEALASTNWLSLPGASWPLKTNHWTLALTNTPVPFYRVRAEQSNP